MGLKVGIIGVGAFAREFIPLFMAHPQVDEVGVTDVVPERVTRAQSDFGIRTAYGSEAEMLAADIDAVAIFTQRHLHGPSAIRALKAGKHVYCAVPAAVTLDELHQLTELVAQTGLTYVLGETSYYYPSTIFCRRRFRAGDFGRFVYGEGAYYHDMAHGFYEAFQHSGGAEWKRAAGFPPMLYPTHSTSMVLSVTGARVTSVSCLGYLDRHEDEIFRVGANDWDNPFSNQTALCRTSDGGMLRVNEFRRTAGPRGPHGGVIGSIYGTQGVLEQNSRHSIWWEHEESATTEAELLKRFTCDKAYIRTEEWLERQRTGAQEEFFSGKAPEHPTDALPPSFTGLLDGHMGSHQFLVHDFCRAASAGKQAPNNIWDAARYNAPGIVARDSALAEGEMMPVPDFGEMPKGFSKVADIDGSDDGSVKQAHQMAPKQGA